MFHMDVFLNGYVSPVGNLDQSMQRFDRQKRSVIFIVDRHTSTAVRFRVAIGTVSDLVIARRGRGDPRERLDIGGCQDDCGTLGLDGIGQEDVCIRRKLDKLLLIL